MDTVGKHAESSPGGNGTVIGGVVHDQDQLLMGEFGEQVLQEGDEGIRFLRVAVMVDT